MIILQGGYWLGGAREGASGVLNVLHPDLNGGYIEALIYKNSFVYFMCYTSIKNSLKILPSLKSSPKFISFIPILTECITSQQDYCWIDIITTLRITQAKHIRDENKTFVEKNLISIFQWISLIVWFENIHEFRG